MCEGSQKGVLPIAKVPTAKSSRFQVYPINPNGFSYLLLLR